MSMRGLYRMVPISGVFAVFLGVITTFCAAELVITRPPKNATVLENKRFILFCEASGKPRPRVKWYHNDEEMPRRGINYRIRTTGALRFQEVRVQDRGIYRCKVESGKETLYSHPAHLVVEAEVTIIDHSPSSGKYVIPYNTQARLTCRAAGIPGPSMQWRKNDISIIDEEKHEVVIEDIWEKDFILYSVLIAENLTSSSKFECEAVNQHIGGDTVRSKVFNVIVLPDKDTSKRSAGLCIEYNGTRCSKILGTSSVFLNMSRSFAETERMAAELLDAMHKIEMPPLVKERCDLHVERLICNYMFPPCTNFLDPKPTPLCRESCTAVHDLFCYVQWPQVQGLNTEAKLPTCDDQLPSKWDETKSCTEAGLFDRDNVEVTSECHADQGRWYNGTVNVTKSGKPCQHWSRNEPQPHKRPPSVFRELENSENYCRNAGAEEVSPWCYIESQVPGERWELCDIPVCDDVREEPEPVTGSTDSGDEEIALSWSSILIITIVGSISVIIVSILVVLMYHFLSRRRQAIRYKNTPQDDLEIDIQKLPANMSYHCVEEPVRLNPKLQAYEYPRNNIIYIKDIGQGAFGRVFKAKAPNLTIKNEECKLIAVKMLKEDASTDLQTDFEREASLMAEFDHPNIVKFLGVCAIGKPMCLLFEYMSKGDLNDYLRMCSPEQFIVRKPRASDTYNREVITLDFIDQLDITRQIAAGMVYLAEKCYVHRDLATRNCLISDHLTVKISDFGLARSVHRLEYYKGSDNDAIPIRWMPLESILYNKFSVESDVWSYGVILWEVFSFALQPYYGMTHEEVVEFLKEGKNLVCPGNTPSQVYDLMLKCWNRKPSGRPKFESLHTALSSLHDELSRRQVRESSVV